MNGTLFVEKAEGVEKAVLPQYAHPGDAGLDLRAGKKVKIEPGGRALIPTKWKFGIEEGYVGLVKPRSGLAVDNGIDVGAGVIDSGFRGVLHVLLFNHGVEPVTFFKGDRIAQLVVLPVVSCNVQETDSLSESARGEDGFGSTGVE